MPEPWSSPMSMCLSMHTGRIPHTTWCAGRWLEGVANGDAAYGSSELVLGGFIRVVTHPKVFMKPSVLADALAFAEQLRSRANCVAIVPGPRPWSIFHSLGIATDVKGKLVPDAYLAAFSRFKGLRWRHPGP